MIILTILYIFILLCYILNYQKKEQFNLLTNLPTKLSINNKMYIVIPCYNFEKYIKICILSIQRQTYTNYNCFFINDGSTDKTGQYIDIICNRDPRFIHYKFSENKGPAFSKFFGFEKVKEVCNPNDICIVVDGDDYLLCSDALEHINNTYNKTKCWCTYGSTVGRVAYLEEDINNKNIINFRQNKWYYGHPRTFKTYILNYITKDDFLYKNNTWLIKGTDINFVFKMLEFSGNEKIKFIDKKLYYYRTHPNNTRKTSNKKLQMAHIKYAQRISAIPKYYEKIHIIWCITKKLNFNKILKMINKQTVNDRIILHILLKNIKYNLQSNYKDIYLKQLSTKYYLKQVFKYVQNLRKTTFIDYIIFLENNQNLNNTYIENLYKIKLPETTISKQSKMYNSFIIDISFF